MTIALVLGSILVLVVLVLLLAGGTLKLACYLVDRSATPSLGKAIKIVLISLAASSILIPVLGYLPGTTTVGALGIAGLPASVQAVEVSVFSPIVMVLLEAAVLASMLPTSFIRGLAIALMRLVVAWTITIVLVIAVVLGLTAFLRGDQSDHVATSAFASSHLVLDVSRLPASHAHGVALDAGLA